MTETYTHTASLFSVLKHTVRYRCPRCGKGKIYQSYLKVAPACTMCGENLETLRADDGPAWLTILIVGHIVVPLMVITASDTDWSPTVILPLFLTLTTVLVLAILPLSKATLSPFSGAITRQRPSTELHRS